MRRRVGGIRKERLAVCLVAVDVRDQALGIKVGRIKRLAAGTAGLARLAWLHELAVFRVVGGAFAFVSVMVGGGAGQQRIAALETPLVRRLAGGGDGAAGNRGTEVPLAGHVRVIAVIAQQLGKRQRAVVEEAFVTGQATPFIVGRAHVAFAHQVVVGARHQHGARDGADGAGVVVGQQPSLFDQRIEVGRLDLATEGAEVGIAEIVGHDVQDIGLFLDRLRRLGQRRLGGLAAAGKHQGAGDGQADQASLNDAQQAWSGHGIPCG